MTMSKNIGHCRCLKEYVESNTDALRIAQKGRLVIRDHSLPFNFYQFFLRSKRSHWVRTRYSFWCKRNRMFWRKWEINSKWWISLAVSKPHDLARLEGNSWRKMENGDQDLIILQGQFLKMWNESPRDFGLCTHAIYRPKCPVLVINRPEEMFLC